MSNKMGKLLNYCKNIDIHRQIGKPFGHPHFLWNTQPFHHDVNYDSLLFDSVIDDASFAKDTINTLDVVDDQASPNDFVDEDNGDPPPLTRLGFSVSSSTMSVTPSGGLSPSILWRDGKMDPTKLESF